MKKILTFVFVLITSSYSLFAQDTVHLKGTLKKIVITDRSPQGVFAEFYGRALLFSVNYDRRLFKRTDGFGYTVGVGYLDIDGLNLFSIPVTVNYLVGKKGKYLELGAGATYFNANVTSTDDATTSTSGGSEIVGTLTIGYRSQPIDGGFMFRAGINPLFFQNNFIPWPYISVGYNF